MEGKERSCNFHKNNAKELNRRIWFVTLLPPLKENSGYLDSV